MFHLKAKRRVSSKVNKISDKEYFYFSFTLFLDFNYWQDLIVDTDHFSNVLKSFHIWNCTSKYQISVPPDILM